MDVERSIDIAAPPEKVWAFVSEPELVLQWYLPLKKFEYTGERCHEAGAPLRFEEKVAGRTMKLDCVVTEWEANRSFGFKMLRGDMMKNYQEKWTIHATPSGSRFTFHERGEFPYGILGRIIDPLSERMSAPTVEKMLSRLKHLAESAE